MEKEKEKKEVAENRTVCAQVASLAPPQLELAPQFLCYMMMVMVMMTLMMMMIKRLNAQAQNPNYIECPGTHHARSSSFNDSNC